MTRIEILEEVNRIFCDVFDDESLKITETTTADDVEDWDSLEHINLINEIENRFSMRFAMREITGMKNVGEMIDIIVQREEKK